MQARPIIEATRDAGRTPCWRQIEELLSAPASGAGAPTLARLEDTLTEGYAQALALEAERCGSSGGSARSRARSDGGDVSRLRDELRVARGAADAAPTASWRQLRALLGSLHERTRTRAARLARAELAPS